MPESSNSRKPESEAGAPKAGAPASSRFGQRRRRGAPKPRRLIDTKGPVPNAAIDEVRLTVGVIVGTHGVSGEMRMMLLTDTPDHLLELDEVFLGDNETPTVLDGVRFHGKGALILLEGVETPEAARELKGTPVRIAGADARPLEEDEFFLYQLIGLRASTPEGEELGVVVDLIETGAHDVLVIAPETSRASRSPADELLVPHHRSYVHEIDPEAGTIVVSKPVYTDEVDKG